MIAAGKHQTVMTALTENLSTGFRWSDVVIIFLGVTLATSSIVFIEPAPYDLLVLSLLCLLLVRGLRFPREMHAAILCLGVFVIGNIVAAAGSADPLTTIRSLSARLYMVLAWVLFASLVATSPAQVLRTVWFGYVIAAVLAVIWGALEYFGLINSGLWQGGLRAKGPFKDANVYAPFLVPVAIYALKELYSTGTVVRRVVHALVFIFLAFGILISFSRGAWLNFFVAFSLFSVFSVVSMQSFRKRLNWLLVNTLLVLAAVSLLGAAVTTTSVADRFFQRAVFTQKYDVDRGGRFFTQKQAINEIGMTPLGVGPGRSDEELGLEPHNLYLHVFVEGGWIAGFGFLAFLFLGFYRSLVLFRWQSSLRRDFFVIFASVSGLLLQSFFIDSTHWRHVWLLFAMTWGLIVAHERSKVGNL